MNPVLSHFRAMWIFVLFDLPTVTAKQRKDYALFRKNLLKLGFTMQQYSVYTLFCGSRERVEVQTAKVRRILPPEGQVLIMNQTDKQYGQIVNFFCRHETSLKEGPQQLEMF